MNAYERMRHIFTAELVDTMPGLSGDAVEGIAAALDRAVRGYEVTEQMCAAAPNESELVKIYIAVKKTEGLSQGTLTNYACILRHFFEAVKKTPEDVVANDIRMFLYDYQEKRNVSNRTLDKYREMICWFFGWAYNEEYISRNPARSIKAIRAEIKQRQSLTQLELERLRLACCTKREKAMVEFLYSTGCRISELAAVTTDDLDMHNRTVHLYGKGRKHRTSYINAKCEIAMEEYMAERKGSSRYLFVSERAPYNGITKAALEKIMRNLSARSGVNKNVTPHVLRHTTATQAVGNGMPIEEISRMLGHANLTTTMTYVQSSQESIQSHHARCII